ncbi:hypothetical protein GF406_18105 [candidate division KSB1 bacterium]|nr:hypothetical protein [candidate division KSB1 bacterium]
MTRKELIKYAQDLGYRGKGIVYLIEEFMLQLGLCVVYYRQRYFVLLAE